MSSHIVQHVARIRSSGATASVVGAGFLLEGGYVMTCAHVVAVALGRDEVARCEVGESVIVDLPSLGRIGVRALIAAYFPMVRSDRLIDDPVADISVLQLEDSSVSGCLTPGRVNRRLVPGQHFTTFGFPPGYDQGTSASGEVVIQDFWGWVHVVDKDKGGHFLTPGFSGAPAFAAGGTELIGMVCQSETDGRLRLGALIPADTLCKAWPPLAQPYQRLETFTEHESDMFFGREEFVTELNGKLGRSPFAVVVGPSGSGKSSVVLAGLVPALRKDEWIVVQSRPLEDPINELASGFARVQIGLDDVTARLDLADKWAGWLREDHRRIFEIAREMSAGARRQKPVLLVIDQFEELFTNDAAAHDGAVRRKDDVTPDHGSPRQKKFLEVLEAIAGQDPGSRLPIRAVATLRADYMDAALRIGTLARLMKDADVKLGPMRTPELTAAIEKPAEYFRVGFEDGLVPEIVSEMKGRPGGLPLLQFALDRLWRRQEKRRLTWKGYQGSDGRGGLATAIDEHAETVRCEIADDAALRRVMLQLVRVAEGLPDARAVVGRSMFRDADWKLIETLAQERLVMIAIAADGSQTAEVVHEALIGSWMQLTTWLDEDRGFRLWHQRLGQALQEYRLDPEGGVLTGRRLAEAEDWLGSDAERLTDEEKAFVKDCREREEARRESNAKEQKARIEQQSRSIKRLVAASALLVFAVGAAVWFADEANSQRDAAQLAAADALGRQLGAEARNIQREGSGATAAERAAALAIESWRRVKTVDAFEVVAQALQELPVADFDYRQHVRSIAFSLDNLQLASAIGDPFSSLEFMELANTDKPFATNRFPLDASATAVAFNPTRDLLAIGSGDETGKVKLVYAKTGLTHSQYEYGGPVAYLEFSQSGAILAISGGNRSNGGAPLKIVNIEQRDFHDIPYPNERVSSAALNYEGDIIATGNNAGLVRVFDLRPPHNSRSFNVDHPITDLSFDNNDTILAVGSGDTLWSATDLMIAKGALILLRASDLTEVFPRIVGKPVTDIEFSNDKKLIASGSADGQVVLVDTTNGAEVERIDSLTAATSLAFGIDGALLAVGHEDGVVSIIQTSDWAVVSELPHDGAITDLAFSPDGTMLATGSGEGASIVRFSEKNGSGAARLFSMENGVEVKQIDTGNVMFSVTARDGSMLASQQSDGTLRLLSPDGSFDVTIEDLANPDGMTFSPAGNLFAFSGSNNDIQLFDAHSRSRLKPIERDVPVKRISFSSDGSVIAMSDLLGQVGVYRTEEDRGQPLIDEDLRATTVALSPDGSQLAVGTEDGKVRIIRVADGSEAAPIDCGCSDGAYTMQFSRDGSLFAFGGGSAPVTLVRMADRTDLTRIEQGGSVYSIDFSLDGNLLLIGGADGLEGFVAVVRTSDGRVLARMKHTAPVLGIGFGGEGILLTGIGYPIAHVLHMPETALAKLCNERAGRNLSAAEWETYIGPVHTWAPTCQHWKSEPELLKSWKARQ